MLNALVSLPFLLALAIAALTLWHAVSDSAPKILSALKGQSPLAEALIATRPITVRYAPRQVPARAPIRTSAQWRAAA